MNVIIIIDLSFTDDIDGLASYEEEFVSLAKNISLTFGMEINPTKTKLMYNDNTCNPRITIKYEQIKFVNHFKYLGTIIDEQGSKK